MIKYSLIAAALYLALTGSAFSALKHCDRACMTALTDQYLAALVKHDPSGLPLSRGVRFTENTAEIRIGDGLWVGASEAPSTFKIYAVDPASNQVGFYGVMKENGRPLIAEDCERHENGPQTTHNPRSVPWPVPMGSPEGDRAMAIIGTLSCSQQLDSQVMSFITRLWPRRLGLVDEEKGREIFKIRGGKIHEIETVGTSLPYGTKSGWE